ncbi:MAG: hypothetical protein ACFCU4_08295 [Puniceicoccaceae bacterium]
MTSSRPASPVSLWIDSGGSTALLGLLSPSTPPTLTVSSGPPLEQLAPLLRDTLHRAGLHPSQLDQIMVAGHSGSTLGLRSGLAMASTLQVLHPRLEVLAYDRLQLAARALLRLGQASPFCIIAPRGRNQCRCVRCPSPDQLEATTDADLADLAPLPTFILGDPSTFRGNLPEGYHQAPSPLREPSAYFPFPLEIARPLAEFLRPQAPAAGFLPWNFERHR